MNETDKLIEEQLKTLPPELRRVIDTVPWKSLAQEIGQGNGLNIEQIASLERETMLIIYGFENPTSYPSNLIKEVGVDEATAEKIFDSVWEKIMEPINQKVDEVETSSSLPEIAPTNLPMVEKGEVAHTVDSKQYTVDSEKRPTIQEIPKKEGAVALPDYRYPGGKDPYREPLQ